MYCSFIPNSCLAFVDFFVKWSKNDFWGHCQFWNIKSKLPSNELFWDVLPFISLLAMKLKKSVLFFKSPWIFGNNWREVIVPTLSTLFSWAVGEGILFGEFVWDLSPIFDAVDWNEGLNGLVFLRMRGEVLKESRTCDWWACAYDMEWSLI